MPSGTLANRCIAVLALVLFRAGGAAADEVWTCGFTESRIHWRGRDLVFSQGGAFFLHIKPRVVDIVVPQTTTHKSFVAISYSIFENTQSSLVGKAHFDLEAGATSDGQIALDRTTGRIRQTGHFSNNDRNEIHMGKCSKSSIGQLPSDRLEPPVSGKGVPPAPQPVIPAPERPLVRKRNA